MYSTCLFCNGALGTNDSIEHFPVGKRLAYDEATGRLWVVCKKCDRWNLSPLESRWEAIEDAERLFRATKTRVSTDNIGLAKLADGTELVRVGKPPKIELAVWRYGDQFKKRYVKHEAKANTAAIMFTTTVLVMIGPFRSGDLLMNAMMALAASTGLGFAKSLSVRRYSKWYRHAITQVGVRDQEGSLLRLTEDNIGAARLSVTTGDEWQLSVPYVTVKSAERLARLLRRKEETAVVHEAKVLHGATALNALAMLLPRANREGANAEGVASALKTIDETANLPALLRLASDKRVVQPTKVAPYVPGKNVANAPAHVRLALEMSLHAEDERRAMSGELHELEQRWRDADAIAKISDELLVTDTIDERVQALHRLNQERESQAR